MMTQREAAQRHHRDRPMRHLTDAELGALDDLSRRSTIFRTQIMSGLDDLGQLVERELADRELHKATR